MILCELGKSPFFFLLALWAVFLSLPVVLLFYLYKPLSMPYLIPNHCTSESTAERQMFDLFKREAPEDWIIFHSLKLDRREREIDFVVVAPKLGVFCLEVKGGQIAHDSRTNLWTSTGAHGAPHRIDDPFSQAESAARALMDSVNALSVQFRSVPISHGVMFPSVTRLPQAMVEREGFRVWYSNADKPIAITDFIAALSAHTHRRYPQTNPSAFTQEQIQTFAKLLRSDVTFERNLWDVAKLTERDLERVLTEQQRYVLGFVRANRTAVVQGGAGTGKTLLAVRVAREEMAKGNRVLLVCHNELLGGFLANTFRGSEQAELITAGDVLAVMAMLSGIPAPSGKAISKESLADFYNAVYAHWEVNKPTQYDVLIIDEGQDMVDIASADESGEKSTETGGVERMLILDTLLNGGFSSGRWRFFWDPEQSIFDFAANTDERRKGMITALEPYLGKGFVNLPLSQNCRNTRQIGNAAARVGKLPVDEYIASSVEGMNVEYRVYRNDEEQIEQLGQCIAGLKAQGVHDWNITILSWLTFEKSIVSKLKGFSVRDLGKYKTVPDSLTAIGFSTVGRYKGLENHFVIITDIQDGRFRAKSLYVAMTRAKTHVCLLMSEKRRVDLEPIFAYQ